MCVATFLLLSLRMYAALLLQLGFRLCYRTSAPEFRDVCNDTSTAEFV
jgi:hypothetical protein